MTRSRPRHRDVLRAEFPAGVDHRFPDQRTPATTEGPNRRVLRILIVGSPNSGKSAFLWALTDMCGLHYKGLRFRSFGRSFKSYWDSLDQARRTTGWRRTSTSRPSKDLDLFHINGYQIVTRDLPGEKLTSALGEGRNLRADEFESLRATISESDAYIIAVDVSRPNAHQAKYLHHFVPALEEFARHKPVIVAATKSDLNEGSIDGADFDSRRDPKRRQLIRREYLTQLSEDTRTLVAEWDAQHHNHVGTPLIEKLDRLGARSGGTRYFATSAWGKPHRVAYCPTMPRKWLSFSTDFALAHHTEPHTDPENIWEAGEGARKLVAHFEGPENFVIHRGTTRDLGSDGNIPVLVDLGGGPNRRPTEFSTLEESHRCAFHPIILNPRPFGIADAMTHVVRTLVIQRRRWFLNKLAATVSAIVLFVSLALLAGIAPLALQSDALSRGNYSTAQSYNSLWTRFTANLVGLTNIYNHNQVALSLARIESDGYNRTHDDVALLRGTAGRTSQTRELAYRLVVMPLEHARSGDITWSEATARMKRILAMRGVRDHLDIYAHRMIDGAIAETLAGQLSEGDKSVQAELASILGDPLLPPLPNERREEAQRAMLEAWHARCVNAQSSARHLDLLPDAALVFKAHNGALTPDQQTSMAAAYAHSALSTPDLDIATSLDRVVTMSAAIPGSAGTSLAERFVQELSSASRAQTPPPNETLSAILTHQSTASHVRSFAAHLLAISAEPDLLIACLSHDSHARIEAISESDSPTAPADRALLISGQAHSDFARHIADYVDMASRSTEVDAAAAWKHYHALMSAVEATRNPLHDSVRSAREAARCLRALLSIGPPDNVVQHLRDDLQATTIDIRSIRWDDIRTSLLNLIAPISNTNPALQLRLALNAETSAALTELPGVQRFYQRRVKERISEIAQQLVEHYESTEDRPDSFVLRSINTETIPKPYRSRAVAVLTRAAVNAVRSDSLSDFTASWKAAVELSPSATAARSGTTRKLVDAAVSRGQRPSYLLELRGAFVAAEREPRVYAQFQHDLDSLARREVRALLLAGAPQDNMSSLLEWTAVLANPAEREAMRAYLEVVRTCIPVDPQGQERVFLAPDQVSASDFGTWARTNKRLTATAHNSDRARRVRYQDASDYCRWFGGRLPTVREWFAAGITGTVEWLESPDSDKYYSNPRRFGTTEKATDPDLPPAGIGFRVAYPLPDIRDPATVK